jgi:hypothetical protein
MAWSWPHAIRASSCMVRCRPGRRLSVLFNFSGKEQEMKNQRLMVATAAALLSIGMAAHAADSSSGSSTGSSAQSTGTPGVRTLEPIHTQSMKDLMASTQRLRESIQAMAQQKPGPDRNAAINDAREALLEAQRAMISLPPDMRVKDTVSPANYQKSMAELKAASDRLRQSVQAMADQPAGERRNKAIRDANKALWDTQQAMVAVIPNVDSSTASTGSSSTTAPSHSSSASGGADMSSATRSSASGPGTSSHR